MIPRYSRPRISLIIVGLGVILLLALVGLPFSQPVAAGAGPALLDCKSVSRTGGTVSIFRTTSG